MKKNFLVLLIILLLTGCAKIVVFEIAKVERYRKIEYRVSYEKTGVYGGCLIQRYFITKDGVKSFMKYKNAKDLSGFLEREKNDEN